jgi:2,3-bisphosphoglycerate-independent phosphoglycerate mutase
MEKQGPLVLLILDGWGIAPKSRGNAIELAKKPYFDKYWDKYPHTELFAHGKHVGVPANQVGNSEAGHINIGAGRMVLDDVVEISRDIDEGRFEKNLAINQTVEHVQKNNSKLHVMGLISDGQSPHASMKHLYSIIDLVHKKGIKKVYLHLFTDGRDSPPMSSLKIFKQIKNKVGVKADIVTVIGRFYAMDRNKHWERTEKAYDCLIGKKFLHFNDYEDAVIHSYNKKVTDEFIEPAVVCQSKEKCTNTRINHNDGVIFFNSRSDRARQIAKCFVQKDFNIKNKKGFIRKKILKNVAFCALTDFGPDLDHILTAYPSADLKETLPMILEHKTQLYIAETEKYAHMTYFISGGYADAVNGEDRMNIASPKVKNYASKPEMSVYKITKNVTKVINQGKYEFIAINFANPDMVGHTGNLKAVVEAIEHCDKCIKDLANAVRKKNGTLIITADHGNAERMLDEKTNEVWTSHTTNKVPFVIVNENLRGLKLQKSGTLGHIAPTIYDLYNLKNNSKILNKSLIA